MSAPCASTITTLPPGSARNEKLPGQGCERSKDRSVCGRLSGEIRASTINVPRGSRVPGTGFCAMGLPPAPSSENHAECLSVAPIQVIAQAAHFRDRS